MKYFNDKLVYYIICLDKYVIIHILSIVNKIILLLFKLHLLKFYKQNLKPFELTKDTSVRTFETFLMIRYVYVKCIKTSHFYWTPIFELFFFKMQKHFLSKIYLIFVTRYSESELVNVLTKVSQVVTWEQS